MDLMKNTTFITVLWTLFGIGVIVLGVYREHLYREKDSQQQGELLQNQQRMQEQQTALMNRVNELVKQGKISEKVAKEILTVVVLDQVSIKEEVIKKLSPLDDASSKKNE